MEKPNSLAFETIKLRSLYLNKKRYAALEIERIIPGEHMNDAIKRGKVSIKGLEGKRRDNAPIGSDTQNAVIKILLKEGDVEKAEALVKGVIADLLQDKIDMSKLIISKGLSKTEEQYLKGGTKQQHVELQRRMRKRARFTGEAVPETGDRVPFIMKADTATVTASRKEKASELSEDPLYAQKHGVPINMEYYIHKQIWPAVNEKSSTPLTPAPCGGGGAIFVLSDFTFFVLHIGYQSFYRSPRAAQMFRNLIQHANEGARTTCSASALVWQRFASHAHHCPA
jgi:pentatricopeptide repeat protein